MRILLPSLRSVADLVIGVQRIASALKQGLNPADNFQSVVFTGTTPGIVGATFTLTHNLGRIGAGTGPNGNERGVEFVYWLDGAGDVYAVNVAGWDENSIQLACTAAGRAYTIIVR